MPRQQRARLTAEPRQKDGRRSELRALRSAGLVPASLFGHGEPQLIRIPGRALSDYLRHHPPGGLMDLELEGKTTTAVIRELDRHPITGHILNVGFQRVNLRETIKAAIPVQFVGEEDLIKEGLVLERQLSEIELQGRADLLPETLTVDVSRCTAGDTVRLSDMALPQGLHATKDADSVVASIKAPTVSADVEAALEAEEAAHAALHAEHEAAAAEAEAAEETPAEGEEA